MDEKSFYQGLIEPGAIEVYTDYLEEQGECERADALRYELAVDSRAASYGYGSGDGDGYGYGSGDGYGSGY